MSAFIIFDYKTKKEANEDAFLAARRAARAVEAKFAHNRDVSFITMAASLITFMVGAMSSLGSGTRSGATVFAICCIVVTLVTLPAAVYFHRKYRGLHSFARTRREGGFISVAEKGSDRVLLYGQTLGALRSAGDTRATGYALVGKIVRIDAGEANPDGIINSTGKYSIAYESLATSQLYGSESEIIGFGSMVITEDGKVATARLPLWAAMLLVNNGFQDPLRGLSHGNDFRAQLYDRLADAGLLGVFGEGDIVETMGSMREDLESAHCWLGNLLNEMQRVERERTPLSYGGPAWDVINLRDNAHVQKVVARILVHMDWFMLAYDPSFGQPNREEGLRISLAQRKLINEHIIIVPE